MIITKAPMRITLAGGGTDVASRFHDGFKGATLSVAITVPVWATVSRRFDDDVVACYREVERVDHAGKLKNELIRALLLETEFVDRIEVHSISQLPLAACGLGGSSSFAVALAYALLLLRKEEGSPQLHNPYSKGGARSLAQYVELEKLKKNIGTQDHSIADMGGIQKITYTRGYMSESVSLGYIAHALLTERMILIPCAKRAGDASAILKDQFPNLSIAKQMAELVPPCAEALANGYLGMVIELLNQTWDLKNQLPGVACASADVIASEIRKRGGGAKLCGAGGGGYVLGLMQTPEDSQKLKNEFKGSFLINPQYRGLEQLA